MKKKFRNYSHKKTKALPDGQNYIPFFSIATVFDSLI